MAKHELVQDIRSRIDLARLIDHTCLKPDATRDDIVRLCEEARKYHFFSVCIAPSWVPVAAEMLAQSDNVRITTVIGFPHGNTLSEVKAFEAERVIREGAQELDMVLNIGMLRSAQDEAVQRDIEAVVEVAKSDTDRTVKVIIETALLSDQQKVQACILAKRASAHFVKTSTGFSSTGATVDDIKLMKETVGEDCGVKAAGGLGDLSTVLAMVNAGATRLGCSRSVSILNEMPE